MATTKTLLDTTLESFLTSKKGWISEQSMGNLSSQISIVSSLSETGGTYIPAVDGFIRFDAQSFSSTGFAYIGSDGAVGITVSSGMRVGLMLPVRKGRTAYIQYPSPNSKVVYFMPLKGQS